MKTALLFVPLLVGSSFAPTPLSLAAQGLMRVNPQGANPAAPSRTLAPAFDEATWRDRLASSDLDARMFSFDQLVGLAERDDSVRRQVEEWSRDASSTEFAWTARLLLRELEAERPVAQRSRRGLWRVDPFSEDPFRDLQERLDQWMQLQTTPRLPSPGPGGLHGSLPKSGFDSTRRSHSLEITPEGVKVRVAEQDADGKEVSKEYTASSVEELFQAHPELRDQIGLDVRPGLRGAPTPLGPGFEFFFGGPDDEARSEPSTPDTTGDVRSDILGVALESLDADERSSLGLAADVGLRILRVERGTIAERLGLQRGQVLVELDGAPVRTRDDVTAQIRKRVASDEVRATVVDRWGQKLEARWRPDTSRSI